MSENDPDQHKEPKAAVREARIQPKVAMWIGISAGTLALVMFSLLFLHAAVRNGWGPFDGI